MVIDEASIAEIMLLVIFGLIAIFLYISYFNKKYLIETKKQIEQNNQEFRTQLTESNSKMLEQVVSLIDHNNKQPSNCHDEKNLFTIFVKLRSSIKENCFAAMNNIKAGRLAVYLFHNGTCSTHGIKFFKMSCICEKVIIGSGIRERSIEHSNIPINLFDDMIDKLMSNGKYIIMNDDNISASNHKIFVSSPKVNYAQAVAIFDTNNNILGFVLAEMEHPYDRDIAIKEKNELDNLVSQLTPIFSYSVDSVIKNQHE